MKKIIYNKDNLTKKDINNKVLRAKLLMINSNDEILLGHSHGCYQIIGGHIEDKEDVYDCIVREVKEETGIDIKLNNVKPIIEIKYLTKDYPKLGNNTEHKANYYYVRTDLKPNLEKVNYTKEEKEGSFKCKYINKSNIIDKLEKNLKNSEHKNIVSDTLEVVKEYLNIEKSA